MALEPRAVVVHRRTEYDDLLARHGTPGQAEFFLRQRGLRLTEVAERHTAVRGAVAEVSAAIPPSWRRAVVERADLSRFAFESEDVVVVVGPDGLVANAAKYLDGQPVVGVDPEPGRNAGLLVPHSAAAAGRLLRAAAAGGAELLERTMVEARTDDGEALVALNEVYVGHPSHQSARYRLGLGDRAEVQSSSGLLVGTGTGSTGWLRSLWHDRGERGELPAPADPDLAWFVREAWPSRTTGATLVEGRLAESEELVIDAQSDSLVCFGDGIESDAIVLAYGQRLSVRRAERRLRWVAG